MNFVQRNIKLVKQLFPSFDDVEKEYTVMLVVGFPDPYDAMVLEHDGKGYIVFDLIQFGKDSLDENYSCHGVLTHELIHICLHQKYRRIQNMSYIDDLNYTAFDEGFAHALTYPEDIDSFVYQPSFAGRWYFSNRNRLAPEEIVLRPAEDLLPQRAGLSG